MSDQTRLTPAARRLIGARGLYLREQSGWTPEQRGEHGRQSSPYPAIREQLLAECDNCLELTHRQVKEAVVDAGQRQIAPRPQPLTRDDAAAAMRQTGSRLRGIPPDATPEQARALVEELTEVTKAEIKAAHLERLSQELIHERARTELLVEAVERAVALRPPLAPVPWITPPEFFIHPGEVEEVPVGLLSDAQIGEVVSPEETGGLGQYDMAAFRRRLLRYAELLAQIIDLHRRGAHIRRLVIGQLGDMVEGEIIFEGQQLRIELISVDQLFDGADAIAEFLRFILATGLVEEIHVLWLGGNHGRTTKKKGASKHHSNWDFVMGRYLQAMFAHEPRIKWFIPKSWWLIAEILGWRIYCHHGDDIRSWMGMPWYGLQRYDARTAVLLQQYEMWYDLIVCGDKHVPSSIGQRLIMNGTLVGPSDFSLKIMQSGGNPSQTVFGINEREGRTWHYDLTLERIAAEERRKYMAFVKTGED